MAAVQRGEAATAEEEAALDGATAHPTRTDCAQQHLLGQSVALCSSSLEGTTAMADRDEKAAGLGCMESRDGVKALGLVMREMGTGRRRTAAGEGEDGTAGSVGMEAVACIILKGIICLGSAEINEWKPRAVGGEGCNGVSRPR